MASWTGAAGTSDWYYIKHTHFGYPDDTVTSNWDVTPNTPGEGDSISIGSVYTVTNGSGTYGSLTLGTGASLTTNNFLSVSSVANGGTIGVGGGTTAYFVIRGSAATLTGGGTITLMSNDPQHYGTVIGHDDGASLALTNMDNTINGGGSISGYRSGVLTLINNGTINATGNSSNLYGALNIDAAGGVTNNALIEATGSAGLASASNIDNRNGQITVADGSHADLSCVITGGVLSATGSGQINANGATFDGSNSGGISLSGTVNSYGATLNGAVSNAGTINVGTFNYLYTGGAGATLSGGGNIVLHADDSQHYPSVIYGAQNASVTLTNVDNTISGGGSISDYRGNALTFINRGTVTATGTASNGYGAITIDATGGLTNNGTIEAGVFGSTMNISTGRVVTNSGILEADAGTLNVSDAVSGSGHAVITRGGTLHLNAAAAFAENVYFQGAGTLALSQTLNGTIVGFDTVDTIDASNVGYASGEHMVLTGASHGVQTYALENAGGTTLATLNFGGNYSQSVFGIADDGNGHAAITISHAPNVIAVHPNDLSYSSTASGYNRFIDLPNFEASYPDLVHAFGTNQQAMQSWYNTYEPQERRVETFDGLDYVASYSDLSHAFASAGSMQAVQDAGANHFISYGLSEGRNTTFNGLDYIASYGDLVSAFGANNDAGAYHYIEYGQTEGRTTTFDGLDYIASYSDLAHAFGANEQAGAAHYIDYGAHEGRTTTFDGLSYIAQYTDLMSAFGANNDAGASHYITNGSQEGRSTGFDVAGYEQAHPDLIGQYGSNDAFLTAYITHVHFDGPLPDLKWANLITFGLSMASAT